MRQIDGVGCEHGTEWIIEHLISEKLTPINIEESFESYVNECHPEPIIVAWLELDTLTILKNCDPISLEVARSEWIDSELEASQIVTFDNGGSYYWMQDVEGFVKKSEGG